MFAFTPAVQNTLAKIFSQKKLYEREERQRSVGAEWVKHISSKAQFDATKGEVSPLATVGLKVLHKP